MLLSLKLAPLCSVPLQIRMLVPSVEDPSLWADLAMTRQCQVLQAPHCDVLKAVEFETALQSREEQRLSRVAWKKLKRF